MFSNNIRIVYLYIISFITLVMLVSGVITSASNIAKLVFPERNFDYETTDYEKQNDTYLNKYNKEMEKTNYYRNVAKDLASSLALTVVSLPLYLYHFKKIQKEQGEE